MQFLSWNQKMLSEGYSNSPCFHQINLQQNYHCRGHLLWKEARVMPYQSTRAIANGYYFMGFVGLGKMWSICCGMLGVLYAYDPGSYKYWNPGDQKLWLRLGSYTSKPTGLCSGLDSLFLYLFFSIDRAYRLYETSILWRCFFDLMNLFVFLYKHENWKKKSIKIEFCKIFIYQMEYDLQFGRF